MIRMRLDINLNEAKSCIKLTPEQIDSLRELGNIGSGNAITALSKIINRRIEMSLTGVKIIPFWDFNKIFPDLNIEVIGICSNIEKKPHLTLLQIFSKDSIINILKLISEDNAKNLEYVNDINDLDNLTKSIIAEIGNILAGHYASSLANLMSIKLIPTAPNLALDTIGAITNSLIARYSKNTDYLIIINTEMNIEDLNINGIFSFIPSIETIETIFKLINLTFK
jgi:chemotaxis protein CheC